MKRWWLWVSVVALAQGVCFAKEKSRSTLDEYLRKVQLSVASVQAPATPGSLWADDSPFAILARDYKASRLGDLVTILVVQDVTAQNSGSVATDRSLKASSGIDSAGPADVSAVQSLLGLHSAATLAGKAQASSTSRLRTSLAGKVVAVLANGSLVIEAARDVLMNNERQTILVRGIVRPGDVSPDNTVSSNAMSDLELEIKGKGVLSDGTRPPNRLVRFVLRLAGF